MRNPLAHITAEHPAVIKVGRVGWFAKGVVYVLAGILAMAVAAKAAGVADEASATGDQEASPVGAIKTVADSFGGLLLLWLLAIGMLLYAAWRLVSAMLPGAKDAPAMAHRIGYIASAIMYVVLAVTAIAMTDDVGDEPDGNETVTDISGTFMSYTLGRLAVGLVGLIVIGVGIYRAYKGVSLDVEDELNLSSVPSGRHRWLQRLGAVGEVGRGIGFSLVGFFLLQSAIIFEPSTATGLDGALRRLAREPWGVAVVVAVAIGFAAYGLFCLATFTHRRLQRL